MGTLAGRQPVSLNAANVRNLGGRIAGRQLVSLTADTLRNLGGSIKGEDVRLGAGRDIAMRGGTLDAGRSLELEAGGNIDIESSTRASANKAGGDFTRSNLDRIATLHVRNPGGTLQLEAGGDIALLAAHLVNTAPTGAGAASASGATPANQTRIAAGGSLTLGTVAVSEKNNTGGKGDRNESGSRTEVGTRIASDGDVTLDAGATLTARAAEVASSEGRILAGGRDIVLEAGAASSYSDISQQKKRSGFLSSKTKSQRDSFADTTAVAGTFSGESVTLVADRDIAVKGSNVVATHDATLIAGRDIVIEAATETHSETHVLNKQKSGFLSSGLDSLNNTRDEFNAKGSVVSAGRDLTMIAGAAVNAEAVSGDGNLTVHGSALDAGRNLGIQTAGDLQLLAAYSQRRETTQRTTQSRRKLETLNFELEQTRALLSTLTAGNSVDLNVGGNLAAQTGSTDAEGRLQADRMTAAGVVRGGERQQVSLTHTSDKKGTVTNGPSSKVLGNLAAQGIRSGAADSFAPEAVQSGDAAVAALLQSGLVSVRNQPGVQAALNAPVPNGGALTFRDDSGKVTLTLAGQAKVQAVYNQLRMSETFDVKHFADQGVAQVVTLVAAIALTVTSGGAGAALIGATAGTASAAAANAAFIAMTSTMTGQLAGGASFEQAFQAGLKAGASSAISAGILNAQVIDTAQGMQSINQLANVQTTGANIVGNFNVDTLGRNLLGIGARGVVNAGVGTAIYGGSFGDAFRSSVVADLSAVGANAVGQGTNALSFGNILGHAAVGCAAAAANGRDCASGAIGGAGAAVVNPLLDQAIGGSDGSGWGSTPETAQQWQTATLQLGSMAASAAAAAALGKEGMTAALAAQNETVNNFLTKENIEAKQKRLAAANTLKERAAIVREYIGISADNRAKALADAKSVMTIADLEATRENLAALVTGPTPCNVITTCRTDVLNSISEINGILNSARSGEKMEPVVLAAEAVATLVTAGEYLVARNALRMAGAGADVADIALRSDAAADILRARNILRETRPDLTVAERNQIIKSFDLGSFRTNTLSSPVTEFRYFDGLEGGAGLSGRWSTSQWFATPAERISNLALPNNQATRAATVTLKPGTTVFQGTVAPQLKFGPNLTGGAPQTYNAVGPRAIIKELP